MSGVVLEVDGQRAVAGEERRHVSQDVRAVAADLCLERRDSLVDTVFVSVVNAGAELELVTRRGVVRRWVLWVS